MKSIHWLALNHTNLLRVLSLVVGLLVFGTSCTEEAILSTDAKGGNGNKLAKQENSQNGNPQSSEAAFDIKVTTTDGVTWTYVITKTGKNGLSHFILNLTNCDWSNLLSPSLIKDATVNGQPAVLETSPGKGTGCEVTSDNIIKFDNLPDADVHTIVFVLERPFHNYQSTEVWLKAGNSCVKYEVPGPCCPA
ncbi:MAG TPA: hypothetical protein VFZ52_12265 [Chryseolinea sp.]